MQASLFDRIRHALRHAARGGLVVILSLLAATGLSGCATAPEAAAVAPDAALFADDRHGPPAVPVNSADVFALSEPMRAHLARDIAAEGRRLGLRDGLMEALFDKQQLQLTYDTELTRNAAQAFESRSGNCLSLVIMTAAFAKALGLPVVYQDVQTTDTWSRSGDLLFVAGHVNLQIGRALNDPRGHSSASPMIVIDFMRTDSTRRQHTRSIDESTVLAMYLNNRAAELLAAGDANSAYWSAKAAMQADPRFLAAYNTLGVVYRREGHADLAERVLRAVLAREPDNTHSLSNLAVVLRDAGRVAEADTLAQRLARLQPYPPYAHLDAGIEALQRGHFAQARDRFEKELARSAYLHEAHFGLARAYQGLGDTRRMRRHLQLAVDYSNTGRERAIYAAKLEVMKRLH